MIRQFRPEDGQSCNDIVLSCIRADRYLTENLRAVLLRTETPDRMVERARLFYIAVAEDQSEILGLGGLELNEIRLLYVAPEHHRSRIGSEILLHLQSLVPPALFSDMFVYAAPGAVSFYRAHGFYTKGDYFVRIEGESLLTVFMTRPVSS
jgi:GNAT superfamily N-acetyltransferase